MTTTSTHTTPTTPTTPTIPSADNYRNEYMIDLETKINTEIGYRFWKKYVNAAFWSYISLPINLSITMMTALSTGQATTDNLLPKSLYINISLATLVISVLNTYFRPYVQMNQNIEYMNKWSVLGCQFEEIYYSENRTLEHINTRITRYENLLKSINDLKKAEILETQNFLTDSIHLALRSCYCCLKNKNSWLALDKTLKAEDDDEKKRQEEKRLEDERQEEEPNDDENPDDEDPDDDASPNIDVGFIGKFRALTNVGVYPLQNTLIHVSPEMEQLYLEFSEHIEQPQPKTKPQIITPNTTETSTPDEMV
jgi:hypothetical protein